MFIYRVCHKKYAHDLSGNGSKIYGGRWNSSGIAALYTSGTKSLALLESLTNTPPVILQNNFVILTINVDGKFTTDELNIKDLPQSWMEFPAPINLAKIGDRWLREVKSLMLKVPSVIISSEYNYIVNPIHKDMKKVKIINKEKISLDRRI